MSKAKKIYHVIGDAMDLISAFAMAVIFIVVFANVVLRYVFKTGFAWATELGQYAFVLVCLAGMITATRDSTHFAVTLIIDNVPKIVRNIFTVIIDVAVIVVTIWMLLGGFQMAIVTKGAVTPCMHIPMATNYWELFVCCIFMFLYSVVNFIKHIIEIAKPEVLENAEEEEDK